MKTKGASTRSGGGPPEMRKKMSPGKSPRPSQRSSSWPLRRAAIWIAPATLPNGPVTFYSCGNEANSNNQPSGDYIYSAKAKLYQATLTTPAAFDRFLAGDDSALSARQKTGMRTFIATGCAGCHSGPLLGGTTLQRFGIVKDYWLETGSEKVDP